MKNLIYMLCFVILIFTCGCGRKYEPLDSSASTEYISVLKSEHQIVDLLNLKDKSIKEMESALKERPKIIRITEFSKYTEKIFKFKKNNIETTYSFSKNGEFIQDNIIVYPSSKTSCDSLLLSKFGINSEVANIKTPIYDESVGRYSWSVYDKTSGQYIGSFSCVGNSSDTLIIAFE